MWKKTEYEMIKDMSERRLDVGLVGPLEGPVIRSPEPQLGQGDEEEEDMLGYYKLR